MGKPLEVEERLSLLEAWQELEAVHKHVRGKAQYSFFFLLLYKLTRGD